MPVEWVNAPHGPALESLETGLRDRIGAVLIGAGAADVALAYLVVTPVAALVAVWLGTAVTRTVLRWRPVR